MINKKAKVIIPLLLGIITLNGVVSTKLFARQDLPDEQIVGSPAGVSCYLTGRPLRKNEPQITELENAKNQLESLYIEKKINEETYNTRMEKINAQLKKLELESNKPEIKFKERVMQSNETEKIKGESYDE